MNRLYLYKCACNFPGISLKQMKEKNVYMTSVFTCLLKGVTEWIEDWKKKGRLNPEHPKAVCNIGLIKELERLCNHLSVLWVSCSFTLSHVYIL